MSNRRTIRIAQVTTVPESLGFFDHHIDYWKARGFEIHLVSSPGEYGIRLADKKRILFHSIQLSRTITPVADLRSLAKLCELLRHIRPDIVHSHTPKAGFLGTMAARIAGVPIVFLSLFGLPQMTLRGPKRVLLDLLTRTSCRMADRTWIDSPSMKEYIISRRLCRVKKAMTVGAGSVNGVDAIGTFSPEKRGPRDRTDIRAKLGIPEDSLVLGYVGRIVRDKGMHELAEAWRILKAGQPKLRLLIVGGMEAKDPILPEDKILFESDKDVSVPGICTDIPAYMAAMDIFVMPSYREGFGMTNIEAAAMRLPVVSTAIPGCVDSVKNGITGTLVPPRDSNSLAAAIRAYIADPGLREAHGLAGRERVLRDFRPVEIWQGLYEEYRQMLLEKGLI
jgi:glycosyltransferase involved in cell wall biosynthesis